MTEVLWKYRFPFHEVQPGKKIAIYGAGEVGKDLYSQNKYMRYCRVVLWVDREWKNKKNKENDINSPEMLLDADIEYIIIAVASERVFRDIKKNIDEYGLDNVQIVGPIVKNTKADLTWIYDTAEKKLIENKIDKWFRNNEIKYQYIDYIDQSVDGSNDAYCVRESISFKSAAISLMKQGIKREKIYSEKLLYIFIDDIFGFNSKSIRRDDVKQFLITGAGFHNMGAQAMLYTTVYEIYKVYPDAVIWVLPLGNEKFYSDKIRKKHKFKFWFEGWEDASLTYALLMGITAIIDISGYIFSTSRIREWYVNCLKASYEFDIPVYLMPQSFGPFSFSEEKNKELKVLLSNVNEIYAREIGGYNNLISNFDLSNVKIAKDIVLTEKYIDYSMILNGNIDSIVIPKNSIALIPNIRLFDYIDKTKLYSFYYQIVNIMIGLNKKVYIINHAEDFEICRCIYEHFTENENVILWEDELNSIIFESMVSDFDYIISSRYHSIVQGYKKNVPSIVIGWADKYKELVELFGQDNYLFDINRLEDVDDIEKKIIELDALYLDEKNKIKKIYSTIDENCFEFLIKLRSRI